LLEHSIDVAERVVAQSQLNNVERDIAIVSALIHDIGKTKTLAPNCTRTSLGMVVDHTELTLEICAQALSKLDKWSGKVQCYCVIYSLVRVQTLVTVTKLSHLLHLLYKLPISTVLMSTTLLLFHK
jgi:ribosomal protein L28